MGPNLCYKPLLLAPWFVTGKEMHPLLKQKTFLLLLPWKLRKIRPSSKASLAKLASQIILSPTEEELGFQWRFPQIHAVKQTFLLDFFFCRLSHLQLSLKMSQKDNLYEPKLLTYKISSWTMIKRAKAKQIEFFKSTFILDFLEDFNHKFWT